ncbi:MAG: tetratricopeptide repeat protein [Acidobacteriota bacterium]
MIKNGETWRGRRLKIALQLVLLVAGTPLVLWGQSTEPLESALAIEDPRARIAALRRFTGDGVVAEQAQTAREAMVASWAQLAEKQLNDNNIERATADFRQAIAALPRTINDRFFIDTVIRIPQASSMRGYRLEAIELARLLEKRFASEAVRLAALGEYYLTIEAPVDGIRALESAVKLNERDPEIRRRLAQAYRIGLRLDEAIQEYQFVIGLNRRDKRGYFELANLYRARGALNEAIDLYKEQLKIEPRHTPSWKGLALAWLAYGDDEEYARAIEKAREVGDANDDPGQDVYLQTQAALINLVRGRLAAARQAATAALTIEPRYAWARIANAEVDLTEGKYFEAERNLLAARQYASFASLLFTFGKLYLTVEDFDGALEQLTQVVELTAEGRFRARLGGTLEMEAEGLRDLFGPEHQAAILLNEPPTPPEIFQIAESLLRLNHHLKDVKNLAARRDFNREVDRFLSAEPQRRVFRALYLAGRFSGYPELAEKVIELTNLVFETADEVTVAEGSLRDYPNYDRQGRRQTLRGRALDYRGWALYKMGRQSEAEKTLLEAIAEYGPLPEVRRALWHLGTVRETAGALKEALELYIAAYEPPATSPGNSPGAGGERSPGKDLKRTVIELLYRQVHGSLAGLESQLQQSVDLATIDPRRGLGNIFGPAPAPKTAPAAVKTPEPRPEIRRDSLKGLESAGITARLTLPKSEPSLIRPATPREEAVAVTAPPAAQPVTERAPVRLVPVILPSIPISIVITDPLSPFFNQQKYYARWDSFRLVEIDQTPPVPRQN